MTSHLQAQNGTEPSYDAFVSHSSQDAGVARSLVAALEKFGLRCFVTPRDIVPGKEWGEAIIDGIRQSRTMVLVYSSHSNDSKQVLREVERAVNRSLPIVPFRIENLQPSRALEYFISAHHWLDAFEPPVEDHFEKLSDTVQALLTRSSSSDDHSLLTTGDFPKLLPPRWRTSYRWFRKRGSAILLALAVLTFIGALALVVSSGRTPFSAPDWPEAVRAEDWIKWRKQVHDKLGGSPVTEQSLRDALLLNRPGRPSPNQHAVMLRREQALADVFLSYEGVRSLLGRRFGIDDSFLGTGLAKPVNAPYAHATIHEYLIPNHADSHARIWTKRIDADDEVMDLPVQDLIEKDTQDDARLTKLRTLITQRLALKDKELPPVVRFALLNAKDYSHRLGRKEALRVFACNLSEVWTRRLREATELSGCPWKSGASVYIWVFLPNSQKEVTPATWGDVFRNAPDWLKESEAPPQ